MVGRENLGGRKGEGGPDLDRGREENSQPRRNDLPPEILDILVPALKVGGFTGISGMFVGSFAGVIRTSTPKLFALTSGIQWFTLGTTFWASRGFVLQAWGKDKVTPQEKVLASAIAGGVSGMVGGALRALVGSRKNVIPGAIMFTIFGATGQALYNIADARNADAAQAAPDSKENSWLNSKWSPMTLLSDREYENMLQEKLLRVNAQISLVDESIEALRMEQARESKAEKGTESEVTKSK